MKLPIKITVRDGEKTRIEDAILWIGELPPSIRRGGNRHMKNRRYKRDKIARRLEVESVDLDRGDVPSGRLRRVATLGS